MRQKGKGTLYEGICTGFRKKNANVKKVTPLARHTSTDVDPGFATTNHSGSNAIPGSARWKRHNVPALNRVCKRGFCDSHRDHAWINQNYYRCSLRKTI